MKKINLNKILNDEKISFNQIILDPNDTIYIKQKSISRFFMSSNLPSMILSLVNLAITLKNTDIGYALFQKKPEFGPAELYLSNISLENVTKEYLLEKFSKLTINGLDYTSNVENIKSYIYNVEEF